MIIQAQGTPSRLHAGTVSKDYPRCTEGGPKSDQLRPGHPFEQPMLETDSGIVHPLNNPPPADA